MSWSDRKALPDVRKWLEVPRGFALVIKSPPGFLGVVRRSSPMFESGRVALPDFREWSGRTPGCPKEV